MIWLVAIGCLVAAFLAWVLWETGAMYYWLICRRRGHQLGPHCLCRCGWHPIDGKDWRPTRTPKGKR